jgi:hypothetical protein
MNRFPWALHVLAAEAILVDGNFAGVDHSWIRLDRSTIRDVYAVGRLPIVQDDIVEQLLQSWGKKTHSVCEMINDVCWMCRGAE